MVTSTMETSQKEARKRGRNVSTDILSSHKVNHVALVIDKSGSMARHEATVIRVVDEFVKGLKEESRERIDPVTKFKIPRQETRISLYAFDHGVECLVWDMSVEDLPSMRDVYRVRNGATSLIEATVLSLEDLRKEVSQKYGEHSFLQIVWTDGIDNASGCSESGHMHSSPDGRYVEDHAQFERWKARVKATLGSSKDNETSAILVPDVLSKRTVQSYGFAAGNIATWDADTTEGVEEAIGVMTTAATGFLRGRSAGVRSTTSLFAVGQDLDVATVKSVLAPLDGTKYKLLDVKPEHHDMAIRAFVEKHQIPYKAGMAYYQLGPRVIVQASKDVAVFEESSELVYGGPDARELLFGAEGRTSGSLSVKAGHNPDLKTFIQSKSHTRKLKQGTRLLVML